MDDDEYGGVYPMKSQALYLVFYKEIRLSSASSIAKWFGVLVLLICGACQPVKATQPLPTSTIKMSPIASFTATQTSQPIPTSTLVMTSAYPIATSTLVIPTTTQTPLPTLTASERIDKFRELLTTNLGCRFPCWWGITPGKSTWAETRQFLTYLGPEKISSRTIMASKTLYIPSGFDLKVKKQTDGLPGYIYNTLFFVEEGGIVERIHVNAVGFTNYIEFQRLWINEMPRVILREYGIPSRIWFWTYPSLMGHSHGYDLWLIYDQQGFILYYEGLLEVDEDIFHICIYDDGREIAAMKMHLQSPDDPTPLERMGYLTSFEDLGILDIEAASGLSVEAFYQRFTRDDQPACFETPIKIWQTPQP
ncbi:MAG: hypothetical protein AB1894_10735 [Chloroflexota bacterium]